MSLFEHYASTSAAVARKPLDKDAPRAATAAPEPAATAALSHSDELELLRKFDLDSQFGPCVGMCAPDVLVRSREGEAGGLEF